MTVKTKGDVPASSRRAACESSVRAETVEQLSRGPGGAGEDAGAATPLESHAQFAPDGPRDPVGLLLGQAKSRVPELAPVRHGRMSGQPVHILPGRRAADGRGPGRLRPPRAAGPAVRGRAHGPISARSPHRSATWSSTSTTSTRPCPARSSGTSNGWRRAWPWPGGTTGSPPKTAARSSWRRPKATAPRCSGSRSSPSCRSGRRPGHRAGHRRVPVRDEREEVQGGREAAGQAHTADSTKALRKLTTVTYGPAADHQRPADDRPHRGASDVQADAIYEQIRAVLGKYRRTLQLGLVAPAGAVHAGPGGPQGRRGRQRRDPRLGAADGRLRRSYSPFLQAKEAQPSVLAEYCGRKPVQQPGRARRRRAAPYASRKRTSSR